jgi:tripartite-type tricarboxylate transporter receptor subunit TctC
MKRLLVSLVAVLAVASLVVVGCSSAAPAAAPTKAAEPAKAAAPAAAAPAATTAPAAAPAAAKTNWPENGKSITCIVASDAGGSSDVGARLISPLIEKELGVPIQVVNKPGAGWQVGLTELAKAKPDGYTFGMAVMPQANTIYLDPERKAAFDRKSFLPIGLQVQDPGIIAVSSDSKYKTLQDLIDDAKANPSKITASTTGIMGDDHLNLLRTQQALGIKLAPVHFTGGAPSIAALLGGHVAVNFNNVGDYMTQFKAGSVRFLAITSPTETKFYPGVKTFESITGKKQESSSTRGFVFPAGVPQEIVDKMAAAFKKAWDNPDLQKKLEEQALTAKYMTPKEFGDYWDEMDKGLPALMEEAKKEPGTVAPTAVPAPTKAP